MLKNNLNYLEHDFSMDMKGRLSPIIITAAKKDIVLLMKFINSIIIYDDGKDDLFIL